MKEKVIYIRCNEDTFNEWRIFVAAKNFKDYEQALKFLLDFYKTMRAETFSSKRG